MRFSACQIILYITVFVKEVQILHSVSTAHYEMTDTSLPSGHGELLTRTSLGSKLVCAAYCARTADCDRFLFKETTTDCMLVGVSNTAIAAATLSTWLMFQVPSGCPSGFTNDLEIGVCYKIYTAATSWYNARAVCTLQGTDLVTMDTINKHNHFKDILPYNDYHIGAKKSGDKFKWLSTGDEVDSNLWGSGCPDNPNTELCIALTTHSRLNLNDIDCSSFDFRFICEYSEQGL